MQRVGGHPAALEPPCQLEREEHVGQLRLPVDPHGSVVLRGLEVVEGDPATRRAVRVRRHVDDAGGADARIRSSSRFVRRKGPRWFVANVASKPSTVSTRSVSTSPALLTSTSSFGACSRSSVAPRRTDDRSARSNTASCTRASPPSRCAMAATAARPLSALRAVTITRAPIAASAAPRSRTRCRNYRQSRRPFSPACLAPAQPPRDEQGSAFHTGAPGSPGVPPGTARATSRSSPYVSPSPGSVSSALTTRRRGSGRRRASDARSCRSASAPPCASATAASPRWPPRRAGSPLPPSASRLCVWAGSADRSKRSGGNREASAANCTYLCWRPTRHRQRAVVHRDAERPLGPLVDGVGKTPFEVRRVAPVLRRRLTRGRRARATSRPPGRAPRPP